MLLLIIRSTKLSTKKSNILSFLVSSYTFCVYMIPCVGQVSLKPFSLFGNSERPVGPTFIVLVIMVSFDGRMSVSGW